mgnify:CR=1 FL=1
MTLKKSCSQFERPGPSQIAKASQNVNSTAQTLSTGASQQASSLQETTSSLEQMSASISASTKNANQTNILAEESANMAIAGGAAVDKTVDAMESISKRIKIIEDIVYEPRQNLRYYLNLP